MGNVATGRGILVGDLKVRREAKHKLPSLKAIR